MSKEADRLIAWLGEVHAVPPFDVSGLVRDVEAAAEERGRRSGVEEQADLLLECEEALVWCSAADAFSPDGIAVKGWQRIVAPVLERIRAVRKNLAPRDSGPQHKDWCALFGNPEAGKSCDCAPRDSGKKD